MNFLIENWQFFIGSFSGLILYVIRDRYLYRINRKKGDVEVKKEELDYANETREYFLNRESDLKAEKQELKDELKTIRDESKAERLYYREKQTELRTAIEGLQTKFDSISLNYALEVEKAEKWMQKFFEIEKENKALSEKYSFLERDYEQLKIDHYQLKRDFDKYKKAN